ncbi:hypothetical protein CONLIGDRAFT_568648 [Coniochaeta ligniaria NRRL 30616]|uniref:DUF8004 domain-containing protein n=1 Tax=Coniochaeta ligniaria NRRL 30616 TaxID=1408157 RepID=A0A1J7J1B7_9PEZI|nr:hypothetical protein CONLIGDRAFT_568648 [Coniochaeta ligniaria NRRL 30616]
MRSNSAGSTGQSTVYTGISNRARGWKSTRIGDSMEGRTLPNANIKRWDGGAKACAAWDNLRRDPELWFDNGNCLVHLHGKGQSRRGPAFKVPLSTILTARCHPLLNRYLLRNVAESARHTSAHDLWNGSDIVGRVDLYITPPPRADKKHMLDFYLAIRNLFAWIYRRSMVGEHLGGTLITLMDSMREFRSPGVDNVADVMSYLEEEGYLDMANQPIHALAMVHLAEYYKLRELYINAFAHCAGMGDGLYALPEYQAVSSITRKLLRRAQASVETKLSKAAMSLRNFLEDDLSEANIGLTAGGRAHLERFRTFLLAFYTHRLGYYPPSPVHTRNGMWDPEIYRAMRADFEALYDFLVDRTFRTTDSASFLSQGGICALQSVHAFDLRHRYRPLPHPLPRLPEVTPATTSKRASWFGRGDSKLRPDRRLLAHAALVKATNTAVPDLARNALVAAYKRFEEDSLSSEIKFDKIEKLSQVDARKIRWILIYGVHQTLRSCTDAPLEVRDTNSVGYSLAISTSDLPPWKEKRRPSLLRTRSKMSASSPAPSVPSSQVSTPATSSEIRPDIDYFALRQSAPAGAMPYQIPPRSGSLPKLLSRPASLRQSLGSLRGETRTGPAIEPSASQPNVMYHEIVMRGYGNGTNKAHIENERSTPSVAAECLANRSPSTSSHSSAGSSANASDSSPRSDESWSSGHTSIVDTSVEGQVRTPTGVARRASVASNHTTTSSVYSTHDEIETCPPPACPPPALPRRNSKRKSLVVLFDEHAHGVRDAQPAPLRVRKGGLRLPDDPDKWRVIEDEVDERCGAVPAGGLMRVDSLTLGDGEIPEWDSFTDVGALTALAPVV